MGDVPNSIDGGNQMIKNNNNSHDTQGERIERLALLSANIDDFADDVGVAGDRLTAAQTAKEDYLNAIAEAGVQDGQMDEAFEEFKKSVDDLTKHYAKAKDHLLAIIWELDKPDDFIEAYGFCGRSPYRYPGLLAKIKTWKSNHYTLVAAGDERVLTDAAMVNLLAKYDAMDALRTVAYVEKHESNLAYAALHELYDAHTKLMDFIYTGAVLAWGDDDSRLRLLGFLPSSEVHTPGQPEPGTPVHPEEADFAGNFLGQETVELIYGGAVGAVKGTIRRAKSGAANYVIIARGLPMDDENRVPFRDTHVGPGEYMYEFIYYNEAQEPSLPSYTTVTVPEEVPV